MRYMGTPCCLTLDQWIGHSLTLIGIVVGALVAVWVVKVIQNKLTDDRVLKDYFISEIKDIRDQYRSFVNDLLKGAVEAKAVMSWFKLLNIRTTDLMTCAKAKYEVNHLLFQEYHYDLLACITESEAMSAALANSSTLNLSQNEKSQLINIQQQYLHLFNEAIIAINDSNAK